MKIKIFILILISFFSLCNCKKGEEDPAFSIYSRTNRISKTWDITYYNYSYKESENQKITYHYERIMDKNVFTEKYLLSNNSFETFSGSYTSDFTIEKNGTYTKQWYLQFPMPYDTTISFFENGNWYFVAKNKSKEYKNKEVVAFQPTSIIYSPNNTYVLQSYTPYLYEIIRLADKEVKMKRQHIKNLDTLQIEYFEDFILSPK